MVYVDPLKLEAHQFSPMDVVRQMNESNLILPAGDVEIGPFDYNLYTNAQAPSAKSMNRMPLKTMGSIVGDGCGCRGSRGRPGDPDQYRAGGWATVGLFARLKQGGDTNTIAVVNGIRDALKHLVDVPKQLVTRVVFDQSVFVKTAIKNLIDEGAIGLVLTGWMVLMFLGSHAGHGRCFFFHSAFGAGCVSGHQRRRRNCEHHGAGRAWRWCFRD